MSAPQVSRPPAEESAALAPVRILLVEDNQDYAMLVTRTLDRSRLAGFQVDHVDSLDAAFRRVEQQSYDAMLLDLSLPDGYGAFTVSYGCSIANHLPVLVLTGISDDHLAMTAMKAGAQEYLVKDRIERGDLPGMILRAIARQRRLERLAELRSGERPESDSSLASEEARRLLWDPVTGAPNESIFRDRLAQAIGRAERAGTQVVVLAIGLDYFDVLRDLVGPTTSDEILCAAAQRLGSRVRRSDAFARLKPDCFGVALEGAKTPDAIACAARSFLDALSQVRVADPSGVELRALEASIGAAVYPRDGADVDALVENAERAQRRACEAGGNLFLPYSAHDGE